MITGTLTQTSRCHAPFQRLNGLIQRHTRDKHDHWLLLPLCPTPPTAAGLCCARLPVINSMELWPVTRGCESQVLFIPNSASIFCVLWLIAQAPPASSVLAAILVTTVMLTAGAGAVAGGGCAALLLGVASVIFATGAGAAVAAVFTDTAVSAAAAAAAVAVAFSADAAVTAATCVEGLGVRRSWAETQELLYEHLQPTGKSRQ